MTDYNPYSPPAQSSTSKPDSRSSLVRILSIAALVTLGCLIPLKPNLFLTTLGFMAFNSLFTLFFLFDRDTRLTATAFCSSLLFFLTAWLSNWGFSSVKPTVHLNWLTFVPAVALMVTWIGWPLWPERLRRWKQVHAYQIVTGEDDEMDGIL